MKEYFICNGNKYVIEDNNIYKVFNKQLITPNIDELKKVKKLIKNKNKDVFSSSKLNEIAKKNKELYKIDILPDILERMEKFIKDENIELFYKNLETVKFEFDDPIEYIDSNNEHENGFHDAMTNIIHINADTFDCLRNFSKDNDLDFDIVWKIALAHELFHMASCNNLYYETGYIYKGLTEIDYNKKYICQTNQIKEGIATSFTEGITQLFSCLIYSDELGIDNFHKFNNTYEEQARVISQLSLMISPKEIKNAYFHNLGIGYINDKLKQIDKRKVLYCGLSTNMGRLISDKLGDNAKNVSIVKIQCILLQYEKRYLEMSDKVKNKEFIDNINYYYIGYWNDIDAMNFSDETKDLIVRNLNNFYSLYEIEKEKTYTK